MNILRRISSKPNADATTAAAVKKENELRYFDNPLCRANFSYGDDIQEVEDDDDEEDCEADKKDQEQRDTMRFTPKPPSEPKPVAAAPPPPVSPKRMSLIWKRASFTSFGEQ